MRDVAIIGVGMIPFGRRDEDTLMDMLAYASLKALDDAGLGDQSVDAVYVANMGGGMLQHQSAIASSLVDRLSLLPATENLKGGDFALHRMQNQLNRARAFFWQDERFEDREVFNCNGRRTKHCGRSR